MDAEDLYRDQRRTELRTYLEIADNLHEAADIILDNIFSVEEAEDAYLISEYYLRMKSKNLYLQRRFRKQRRNYMKAVTNVVTGISTDYEAAIECRVSLRILRHEIQKARLLGLDLYCFDRPVNYSKFSCWSYLDEEYLLKQLKEWRHSGEVARFSQLCIYEKLSELAYEYARTEGIFCLQIWDIYERMTVNWLEKFDMRHHDEIKEIFGDVEIE